MNSIKQVRKFLIFAAGLFTISFGIVLSVKADLGVSPVSSVPYIYSLKYTLTMGEFMMIMNILFVIGQIILLRKKYQLIQLMQLPAAILFGFFIDLSMYLLVDFNIHSYGWRLFICLLSCPVIAFGIFLEVKSELIYLPAEGLTAAISSLFHKEFGKVKIGLDSSMVLFGALSSFLFIQRIEGIREGTVIAALLIGFLVRTFSNAIPLLNKAVLNHFRK